MLLSTLNTLLLPISLNNPCCPPSIIQEDTKNQRHPMACPKVSKGASGIQLAIEWSQRQGSEPAH